MGGNGHAAMYADGLARIEKIYNLRGQKIAEYYYDFNGELINSKDGDAQVIYQYNHLGEMYKKAGYDANGEFNSNGSQILYFNSGLSKM